jgi:hypothetical protein
MLGGLSKSDQLSDKPPTNAKVRKLHRGRGTGNTLWSGCTRFQVVCPGRRYLLQSPIAVSSKSSRDWQIACMKDRCSCSLSWSQSLGTWYLVIRVVEKTRSFGAAAKRSGPLRQGSLRALLCIPELNECFANNEVRAQPASPPYLHLARIVLSLWAFHNVIQFSCQNLANQITAFFKLN